MKKPKHPTDNWPTNIADAKQVQLELVTRVIRNNELREVEYVAGVDVGFENNGKTTRAAVAVLNYPDLTLHEQVVTRTPTCFPYVPGYLSFRELPGALDALSRLQIMPDLILCDGQGIAHPRRFGLACHLGVVTGLPTIGAAKSRLIGTYTEPGLSRGNWEPLLDKKEIIGAVLRTRDGVNPLFISIGHRVDLETAIHYVMHCTTRFRLPETTRWAHKLASG